jgi:hypothetical protein
MSVPYGLSHSRDYHQHAPSEKQKTIKEWWLNFTISIFTLELVKPAHTAHS